MWPDLGKPSVTHTRPIFAIGVFSKSYHILWKSTFWHKWVDWPFFSMKQVTDTNSFWQDQYKPKRPDMSRRPSDSLYSVHRALLGTLITKCARRYLQLWIFDRVADQSLCFLPFRHDERQRHRSCSQRLVSRRPRPFWRLRWPALSNFVQEFFCGDDPIDSDGKWNVPTTYQYFTKLLLLL